MADNVTIPAQGTGTTTPVVATDDVGSVHYQRVKLDGGGSGSSLPIVAGPQSAANSLPVVSPSDDFITVSTTIARPGNTTTYAANDALADPTPTSGGFTLVGAARTSGGSGVITDMVITMSTVAATSLVGELWIFNQAVSAIADNAIFSLSDSDVQNLVGIVPFTTNKGAANNAACHVQNLTMGFTCVGSANLRFLVKVLNAYVPANAEVLSVMAKIWRA